MSDFDMNSWKQIYFVLSFFRWTKSSAQQSGPNHVSQGRFVCVSLDIGKHTFSPPLMLVSYYSIAIGKVF